MTNKYAQRESTLLAVIAQAQSRGAGRQDIERYFDELKMESSRKLVTELFDSGGNAESSSLRRWAQSLVKTA